MRWMKRIRFGILGLVLALLIPYAYVETQCHGDVKRWSPTSTLSPQYHRPQSQSFTTYPEWHIVHAYDDYAAVISTGDPHDYAFIPRIVSYWTSMCAMTRMVAPMGGVTPDTKQMLYAIGYSLSIEWLFKAAYEETIGRVFTMLRGPAPAPTDQLSAQQAVDYAKFLQQTPWYKWDFTAANTALARAHRICATMNAALHWGWKIGSNPNMLRLLIVPFRQRGKTRLGYG